MVGAGVPARRVYADERAATLAVREATLVVRVLLFLMSCMRVVHLVVAAATRLSRYPSNRAKVSGGSGSSSAAVTTLAAPL